MKQLLTVILSGLILPVFCASALYAQEGTFEKGIQAYLRKDFKSASGYLKEAVAVKPDPGAYYLLGYSTYLLSKKAHGEKKLLLGREAADYFNEAYLIDPGFSPKSLAFRKIKK